MKNLTMIARELDVGISKKVLTDIHFTKSILHFLMMDLEFYPRTGLGKTFKKSLIPEDFLKIIFLAYMAFL